MSNFKTLCEEWDQKLHTTWTYKKQKKLILQILEKCPTAKSFIDTMSKRNNPKEIQDIINQCHPDFNDKQYLNYLKTYVIKYSFIGKYILSTLMATAVGALAYYGAYKYLENQLPDSAKELNKYRDKDGHLTNIRDIENNEELYKKFVDNSLKTRELLTNNPRKYDLIMHRDKYSFIPATIAKLGSKPLLYYGLDKLDKDRI